jgi:putative ABC transport system permease protein
MTGSDEGRRPPRLAEYVLRLLVGSDAEGRSILGDAREELDVRGRTSRLGATIWYWAYVFKFAVSYRTGGKVRHPDPEEGRRRASAVTGLVWDAKSSTRSLLRRPWLSIAVITTLAVGIGTTTLAFALVDGVLLRPLPFPAPEELVDVSRVDPAWYGPNPTAAQAGNVFATPAATFFDWERSAATFSSLGAYAWRSGTFSGDAAPERIIGAVATGGVFEALAVPAALGRHLTASDEAPGATPVVVLSHGLWVRRFGSDATIVGRVVRMDGVATTVVGVMPKGFAFPDETTHFWLAFDDERRSDSTRNAGYLHAIGRLAPGSSLAQARAEMTAIQTRLGERHASEAKFISVAFSRHELMVAATRPGLLILLGAAAVVLLVGCANVANLLLARVAERRRELALHAALGASRSRLAGLLLSESTVLAVLGGVGGITLAWVALRPFVAAFPMTLPRSAEIQMDLRVLVVSLLVSVAAGLLLGLLPVARSSRMDLNVVLREGGHGSTGGRRTSRTHALLVVSEVALSVLLLSTSGIFVQSYLNSARQERGFRGENVLALRVSVPDTRAGSEEELRSFYSELQGYMDAIPGVTASALAQQMPYSGCCSSPPASMDTEDGVQEASVHTSSVTPEYFQAMGVPILAGRALLPSDREGSPPVVVVSEAMARRYWPDADPIGKRVRLESTDEPQWHEVVGIAGNVRYQFAGPEFVEYYRAFAQHPYGSQAVILKTRSGAVGVAAAAERAVHALEPTIPVTARSLTELAAADREYRTARIGSLILTLLAAVATGLAVLGVYSVLAFSVLQRTREIGIRVSLGGSRLGILRAVLGGGLVMTGAGVAIGLGLSAGLSTMLRSGLVGVSTVNPWVVLAVVSTMFATSVAASLLPAWRAVRVDPLVAFRED